MIKSEDLKLGQARVLETDNNLILPVNKWIRLLVTGVNVIHSLGVHSLGLKFDGIPGRLNSVSLQFARAGFFRGACMELCGILHAYMPINIHAVPVINNRCFKSFYQTPVKSCLFFLSKSPMKISFYKTPVKSYNLWSLKLAR